MPTKRKPPTAPRKNPSADTPAQITTTKAKFRPRKINRRGPTAEHKAQHRQSKAHMQHFQPGSDRFPDANPIYYVNATDISGTAGNSPSRSTFSARDFASYISASIRAFPVTPLTLKPFRHLPQNNDQWPEGIIHVNVMDYFSNGIYATQLETETEQVPTSRQCALHPTTSQNLIRKTNICAPRIMDTGCCWKLDFVYEIKTSPAELVSVWSETYCWRNVNIITLRFGNNTSHNIFLWRDLLINEVATKYCDRWYVWAMNALRWK